MAKHDHYIRPIYYYFFATIRVDERDEDRGAVLEVASSASFGDFPHILELKLVKIAQAVCAALHGRAGQASSTGDCLVDPTRHAFGVPPSPAAAWEGGAAARRVYAVAGSACHWARP